MKSPINIKDHFITKSENDSFRFGIESNLPYSECIFKRKDNPELHCKFDFSTQQNSNPAKTCSKGLFNNFTERLTFVASQITATFKCELELKDPKISGEF